MSRFVATTLAILLVFLMASGLWLPSRVTKQYRQGNNGLWLEPGATVPGQPYGRTRAADLDGDGLRDVAYLRGPYLEAMLAPSLHEALMTGLGVCRDFVVLPGWPRDALLAATQTGLEQIEWDAGGEVAGSLWKRSTPSASGSVWADVVQMCTWSAGGEQPHVFGLIDDGSAPIDRIAWLQPDDGSWTESVLTIGTPVDISHMAAFDYEGASTTPELALVNSFGMIVFDPVLGTVLATHLTPELITVDVARLDMGQDGGVDVPERVAWLATSLQNASQQYLCTVGMEGMTNSQLLGSGEDYYAMVSGDVVVSGPGTSGVDDLVLAKRSAWGLTWLDNVGTPATGPAFGSVEYLGAGVPGTATSSQARPVIADLDGDLDGDVLFPLQDEGKLWVQFEGDVNEEAMKPRVRIQQQWRDTTTSNFGVMLDGGTSGPLIHLQFDVPQVMAGATHMELLAWRTGGLYTPVDPTPLTIQRRPIGEPFDPFEVPGVVSPAEVFDDFVFASAQLLVATSSDPGDPPLRALPARLVFFHGQGTQSPNATSAQSYIQNEGVGNAFEVQRWNEDGETEEDPGGGGQETGTGADGGCKPAPPNTNPRGG